MKQERFAEVPIMKRPYLVGTITPVQHQVRLGITSRARGVCVNNFDKFEQNFTFLWWGLNNVSHELGSYMSPMNIRGLVGSGISIPLP